MPQNFYKSAMAQRRVASSSIDDYPTPPCAARALIEYVLRKIELLPLETLTCLDPASNRGNIAKAIVPCFSSVTISDKYSYFPDQVLKDFLDPSSYSDGSYDWVITNPPFKEVESFLARGLKVSRRGLAMLSRTVLIEGIRRYNNIYRHTPPAFLAVFSQRVPMVEGRLDPNMTTATSYSWFIFLQNSFFPAKDHPEIIWIPPCKSVLTREEDYSDVEKA